MQLSAGLLRGIVCLLPFLLSAGWPTERDWQLDNVDRYKATLEVPLWDGTRCDYETETHAWEIDWAEKSAEAIGQALWYANELEKKPGIILLLKQGDGSSSVDKERNLEKRRRYIYRAKVVAAKYGISVRVEDVVNWPETDGATIQ